MSEIRDGDGAAPEPDVQFTLGGGAEPEEQRIPDERQQRSPQQAAEAARADRAAGVWSELVDTEFPSLPTLWARWAALAAAFVAVGSAWGPRVSLGHGVFESAKGSGSSLSLLPGERAVLSGGVSNAESELPNLYAGAPEWVADPVLDRRVESGLLSFCYWWEAGRWYRGDSPPARDCAGAVPGVWTGDTVAGIVARLVDRQPGAALRTAAISLVTTAELGAVTDRVLRDVFADGDIDGARYQLSMAGVLADEPEPMPQELALTRVRQFLAGRGFDTEEYQPQQLVAERISCGWLVYVPVPADQVSVDRAVLYLADDGVLEPASSATAPATYVTGFERRYRSRRGTAASMDQRRRA